MLTIEARYAEHLLPEQQTCWDEFHTDIRDVVADPAVARAAAGALRTALAAGTRADWARAVAAIAALLDAPARDAPAGARRRLTNFVGENADLLRRAS